jgi:hypothetical protein
MIGSINDGYEWLTPQKLKTMKDSDISTKEEKYQYPIMILNSVEYLECLHNPYLNKIVLFVKAFSGKYSYVGCYSLDATSLTHTLYECTDPSGSSDEETEFLNFYYRPPLIKSSIISDTTKSWIHGSEDIITSGFTYENATPSPGAADRYTRVIGPDGTQSNVTYSGNIDTISVTLLPDGTYMLLYDASKGVQALYSTNQGDSWFISDTVFAKNAKNGVVVGENLFYITSSGIKVKASFFQDFMSDKGIMQKKAEGNSNNNLEVEEQDKWDNMAEYQVSTGAIESQRLSGYISPENYYRVFCYDENNRLKCYGSENGYAWGVVDNF